MKKHKLLYTNKSGENLSDAIDIIRKINNGSYKLSFNFVYLSIDETMDLMQRIGGPVKIVF